MMSREEIRQTYIRLQSFLVRPFCLLLHPPDSQACVDCIEANRDLIVGVKVRLDTNITDGGRTEFEVYRRALEAARAADVPLMVHHTNSNIPLGGADCDLSCPGSLRAGDIYTHLYSGERSNILNAERNGVDEDVKR